ncbi:MAG: sigma-70 family RNA polymerase sigma factor [Planctomycetota bacterium]
MTPLPLTARDERPTAPGPVRPESLAATVPSEPLDRATELLRRDAGDASFAAPSGDAVATALMDLYRRTGSAEVFEALVQLAYQPMLRRVRARTRFIRDGVDAEELLQDAMINIYRYPDRFDASRPGAFKAWSSTIVDNAIRRYLRRSQAGPDVHLRPVEVLAREPDRRHAEPGQSVAHAEECDRLREAYRVFLGLYLAAFHRLGARERFVLQMVEVRGMRYAELAGALGLRPEALKMVVFRARRRILGRISAVLGHPAAVPTKRPRPLRSARGSLRPASAAAV